MGYVIVRIDQGGGYVAANSGETGVTYTKDLAKAQVYKTRDEADKNRCPGNEVVIAIEDIFKANGGLR